MAEDGQEWMHGPTLTGQFSRNPFTPANLPGGFTRGLPLPGLLLGLALEITDHLRAIHGFVSTNNSFTHHEVDLSSFGIRRPT